MSLQHFFAISNVQCTKFQRFDLHSVVPLCFGSFFNHYISPRWNGVSYICSWIPYRYCWMNLIRACLIWTTELETVNCTLFMYGFTSILVHTKKKTPKQYVYWIRFHSHGNWLVFSIQVARGVDQKNKWHENSEFNHGRCDKLKISKHFKRSGWEICSE